MVNNEIVLYPDCFSNLNLLELGHCYCACGRKKQGRPVEEGDRFQYSVKLSM